MKLWKYKYANKYIISDLHFILTFVDCPFCGFTQKQARPNKLPYRIKKKKHFDYDSTKLRQFQEQQNRVQTFSDRLRIFCEYKICNKCGQKVVDPEQQYLLILDLIHLFFLLFL